MRESSCLLREQYDTGREKSHGRVHRQLDRRTSSGKKPPILDGAVNHKSRQCLVARITGWSQKMRRREKAERWMSGSQQRLAAADREPVEINFWLVPEFQPVAGERFGQVNEPELRRVRRVLVARRRLWFRGQPVPVQIKVGQTLPEIVRAKWLLERREHCKPVAISDLLDFRERASWRPLISNTPPWKRMVSS